MYNLKDWLIQLRKYVLAIIKSKYRVFFTKTTSEKDHLSADE